MSPEQLDTLTPAGETKARALKAELPAGVTHVWTSPTKRTRQTAALLGLQEPVVAIALRPLDGDTPWGSRVAAWAQERDPRPEGGGESLADGAARVHALLAHVRETLRPGAHAVLVTHGDIASLPLGELRGTPVLRRPTQDTLGTGQAACLPLSGAGDTR